MTMPAQAAGTPATPASPAAPSPAPVVGTATGESFMPQPAAGAPAAPAAQAPAPAAGAPAAAQAPAAGAAGKRLSLTNDDLKDRIRRAQSSVLKELHGTDDPKVIRERFQKLEQLEKQAEEQRVAQMTEVQRAQHEATKAKAEANRYRAELVQAQEREVVREQSAFVERMASQHVNPAALEEASLAFANHVSKTDPKVVAKWTEKDINAWFKGYVAKKPFMAKTAGDAPAPPARRVVERAAGAPRPAPRPSAPAASGGSGGGKTFRPGQPNSMSRAEAREAARAKGYSW